MATTTPRKGSRGTYDPAHTRQQLLESALEKFGTNGFHATSVQEIVKAAGLTKGAFYHHFVSKEDVLRVIHHEFLDVQGQMVDRILAENDSPTEQIRELVRATVRSAARYQSYVTVYFQERRHLTGEHGADVKRRRDEVEKKMRAIVQRGIESGEFTSEIDPRVALFGVVGMLAWMHLWYRPGGPLTGEAIADQFAQMVLEGLKAKA